MTPLIWLIVMALFVALSLAALGLLDGASARIADAFRDAWRNLK